MKGSAKKIQISAILAMGKNRVIGNHNQLPWRLPADMRHFKQTTTGHVVLMGRKTYESIGKPLPNRTNIVLTHDKNYQAPGCIIATTLTEALRVADEKQEAEVFIIGGAKVYAALLPQTDRIYLTLIHHDFEGDTFFPEIDMTAWHEVKRIDCKKDADNLYDYSFIWLSRQKQEQDL